MRLLANFDMHCSKILVLEFAGLSQSSDSSLTVLEFSFQLFDLKLKATDIKVASSDCLLETLNVAVALLGISGGISQVSLKTLDLTLFLVVSAFHYAYLGS